MAGLVLRGALLPLKLPARRKLRHGIVTLVIPYLSPIAFSNGLIVTLVIPYLSPIAFSNGLICLYFTFSFIRKIWRHATCLAATRPYCRRPLYLGG